MGSPLSQGLLQGFLFPEGSAGSLLCRQTRPSPADPQAVGRGTPGLEMKRVTLPAVSASAGATPSLAVASGRGRGACVGLGFLLRRRGVHRPKATPPPAGRLPRHSLGTPASLRRSGSDPTVSAVEPVGGRGCHVLGSENQSRGDGGKRPVVRVTCPQGPEVVLVDRRSQRPPVVSWELEPQVRVRDRVSPAPAVACTAASGRSARRLGP